MIATLLLVSSTAQAADFDRVAAREALQKVHVKHCGYGGPGEVRVTFAPTGFVSDVEVYDGKYTESAIRCIERLFHAPVVLSFDGEAQTVKWHIVLPLEREVVTVAKPVVAIPHFTYVDPAKWRRGDPVPPGYRVEETPRYGLAVWGGLLVVLGSGLLYAAQRSSSVEGDSGGEMYQVLFGGAFLFAGGMMTLAGLGTSRSELVPVRF